MQLNHRAETRNPKAPTLACVRSVLHAPARHAAASVRACTAPAAKTLGSTLVYAFPTGLATGMRGLGFRL